MWKKPIVCELCSDVLCVELKDLMKACDLNKISGNASCLWMYAVCIVFSCLCHF